MGGLLFFSRLHLLLLLCCWSYWIGTTEYVQHGSSQRHDAAMPHPTVQDFQIITLAPVSPVTTINKTSQRLHLNNSVSVPVKHNFSQRPSFHSGPHIPAQLAEPAPEWRLGLPAFRRANSKLLPIRSPIPHQVTGSQARSSINLFRGFSSLVWFAAATFPCVIYRQREA